MQLALLLAQKYLVIHTLRVIWKSQLVFYRTGYFREQLLLAGFTKLALDETAWPSPGTPNGQIILDISRHPQYQPFFEYKRFKLGLFLKVANDLRIDTDNESLRLREKALKQVREMKAIEDDLMRMHNWYNIGGFHWDSEREQVCYYLTTGGIGAYNTGSFSVHDYKMALKNKGKIIRKKAR